MSGLTSSPWTEQDAWDDLTDRLRHAEAERDRLAGEVETLRARLAAVEGERDHALEATTERLRDFVPNGDYGLTGDLAVDMAAYATRLKRARDEALAKVAAVEALAEKWERRARDYAARNAGWKLVLSVESMTKTLRAALEVTPDA